ncbi:MAG: T9SS type A sorting domain-containing protein [Flavobacteriales bacterium]|nr:T9SS type A sorting domain-containing protein [Flavobacteriales bacterium]
MRIRTDLLCILLGLAAPQLHAQPGTINFGGLQRSYTLRLPSVYDGTTPLPLVICMHGGFGSGTQVENQSQLSAKAEQEGFIMVYPDGTGTIRTWNAGGCCGYAMNNNIDDVGFINGLLDVLIAEHAIDTTRIYATGMSNGGFMSYRLACELSERIAAIAPVSASMTIAACQPTRSVPVISFHSYQDTSVPYLGGIGDGVSNHYNSPQDSVLTAFALHADCAVLRDTLQHDATMTVVRWHACDCEQEMIQYITQDGGHSWHGGAGTPIGDPPSTTISANDLMWDFFQQHSLDCAISTDLLDPGTLRSMQLFPNPANEQLTVRGEALTRLTILDLGGRTVLSHSTMPSEVLHLDLGALAPGTYLLQAVQQSGLVDIARFVRL